MAEEQPERLRRVRDKNRESETKQNENRKLKKKLQEKETGDSHLLNADKEVLKTNQLNG